MNVAMASNTHMNHKVMPKGRRLGSDHVSVSPSFVEGPLLTGN